MDATIVLAGVCALAALVALIAVATALFAIRRSSGADAAAIVHQQIPASLESLRLEVRASLDGATQTLGQRIAQLSAEVDRRLADVGGEVGRRLETTTGMIGERLEGAARAVAEVHQRLGTVQGATERVLEVGRDIASLQQILKAPKLRGGLGELFLGELLAQTLPPGGFELQYAFRGGQRVDAIVRIGDHIIPVDAKFPLENFTRIVTAPDDAARAAARKSFVNDVRRRIDEIADRYILPEEGTFDFALMYVPAENVYYETIVRNEDGGGLYEYSLERRVVPVSPNTLYSYLQVILLGLRGLRIEESAQEILRALGGLSGELERFRQEFATIGKHIEDASKKFGEGTRRLQKLQESVGRLESLGEGGPPDRRASQKELPVRETL